jgi:hypothetical protein
MHIGRVLQWKNNSVFTHKLFDTVQLALNIQATNYIRRCIHARYYGHELDGKWFCNIIDTLKRKKTKQNPNTVLLAMQMKKDPSIHFFIEHLKEKARKKTRIPR